MKIDVATLPNDVAELKSLIAALHESRQHNEAEYAQLEKAHHELEQDHSKLEQDHTKLEQDHTKLEHEYKYLEEKFKILQHKFFGRSSEKITEYDTLQGVLFNEIESAAKQVSDDEVMEQGQLFESTTVKEHVRKKRGRKALPADLPRVDVIHDLSAGEKLCPCCSKERKKIAEETSEELVIIPPQIYVRRHVCLKYGPCECDDFLVSGQSEVIIARKAARMLPQSIVSAELLAWVTTSKFVDALPFYRQEKIFDRIGVDISRATMCNWMINAHEKMKPFMGVFKELLTSSNVINMDETGVQVLKEEGRSATSKSYMWVARGYPVRGKPLVLYEYHPTRSGDIPVEMLGNFSGYLQTDGYDGYNKVVEANSLKHVGCFAHVRRKFFDAAKVQKANSHAHKALQFIRALYEIENDLRIKELDDEEFVRRRKSAAIPVLEKFHEWLEQAHAKILPKSLTGAAVSYALHEWPKLVRYLDQAFLTPDNNVVENAIRPFAVGRKNWLFSNTPAGAQASAAMYSLVESAKANKLDPFAYLYFIFNKLPVAGNDRDLLRTLLPCFVSADSIKVNSCG